MSIVPTVGASYSYCQVVLFYNSKMAIICSREGSGFPLLGLYQSLIEAQIEIIQSIAS